MSNSKTLAERLASWLVGLYPYAWRERYGNELAALLADCPPSWRDCLDIALGALDAHLIETVAWKPLCLEAMRRKRHPPAGGPFFPLP